MFHDAHHRQFLGSQRATHRASAKYHRRLLEQVVVLDCTGCPWLAVPSKHVDSLFVLRFEELGYDQRLGNIPTTAGRCLLYSISKIFCGCKWLILSVQHTLPCNRLALLAAWCRFIVQDAQLWICHLRKVPKRVTISRTVVRLWLLSCRR